MMISIISRNNQDCGIMSNAWVFLGKIYQEIQKNNTPVIDMKTHLFKQFHDNETFGKVNVWNDYFKQPFDIDLDNVDISKAEIIFDNVNPWDYLKLDSDITNYLARKYLRPSDEVQKIIDEFFYTLDINKTVGVIIRGTDYRSMHPINHNIQPNIQDIINDIRKCMNVHNLNTVFLVTDTFEYIQMLHNNGINVRCLQTDFLSHYYTSGFNNSIMSKLSYQKKLIINRQYVASVFILSKLKYNILSETSATCVIDMLKNPKNIVFEKKYDLGVYK